MKKLLVLVLALMLFVLLVACTEKECAHEWQAATCKTPSKCSLCGQTQGEVLEHEWQEATCQTPSKCSLCEQTQGDVLEHDWKSATCTTPKTCKVCNETNGSASGHDWKSATCTTPKTCKVCNETNGSASGHNWKSATCTTPKTCKVCNAKEGQELGCQKGNNGSCIRCGKSMLTISEVLSAPLDSMSEIKSFVPYTYSKYCYSGGNYRLIFNSADGVYLSWGATNTTNKEIKYITFTLQYYNRVGDPAYDNITNKTSTTKRLTGPIGAGKSFYIRALVGYGSDIYYGVITDVKIEYMDGTVVSGNYGYTTWHNIRSTDSPNECVIFS